MNDERLRQLYQRGIAARDGQGGTACEVAPEDLLALVRGELPEERRLELFDRVMSSERCRSEFELLRAVERAGRETAAADARGGDRSGDRAGDRIGDRAGGVDDDPGGETPDVADVTPIAAGRERSRETRRASPWWRRSSLPLALAATALLAVGVTQYGRQATPTPDVMRGAADGIVPVAPAEEVAPGTRPEFIWSSVPGASRYAFELLDADGSVVHQTATTDTVITLPESITLGAGADYRWIVRATDSAGAQRASTVRRLHVRGL